MALAALVLFLGACRTPELPGETSRLRFIAEDPPQLLDGQRPIAAAALARILDRSWKVDLDHEVRNALPAVPGRVIERWVEVTPGQRLVLGWGMETTVDRALTFRVRIGSGDGEELLASRLEPGDGGDASPGDAGVWHQARVSLDNFVGRQLLRLTVESDEGTGSFDAAQGLAFWAHPEVVATVGRDRAASVLLVSLDTLRADRLSSYGYQRPTSPRLDAWAAERATLFRHAVAAAPWTLPSHVSMLTGLEAIRHGVNHDVGGAGNDVGAVPNSGLETLAEILREAGYATAAFTGGAYMHPKYGFAQGFDRYAYWPDRARARREMEAGVDRALEWMTAEKDVPSFFFLHTYAVHDPYAARQPFFDQLAPELTAPRGEIALESPPNDPSRGFRQLNRLVLRSPDLPGGKRLLTEDDRELIDAFYDSGVAYADAQMGRLFNGLAKLGLDRDILVVVTSDHGEALGEGGDAGHVSLRDHTLLVPLMIALPDGRRSESGVIEDQVRSIDLVPTILDYLGFEVPTAVDGASLLPLIDGAPSMVSPEAWSYSAAACFGLSLRYGDRLKYVFDNTAWPPGGGGEELYDLRRDPAEEVDMAAEGGPRLEALRARLQEVWDEQAAGLRLRVANASEGTLRGDLEGPMVRSVGTKSLDGAARFLIWGEIGKASFELPAGESFTLQFEKVFGPRLRLSGELDLGDRQIPYDHRLEAPEPPRSATLAFEGRTWDVDRHADRAPVKTGFEIRWNGAGAVVSESPSTADPALRRQLEALGYVQ